MERVAGLFVAVEVVLLSELLLCVAADLVAGLLVEVVADLLSPDVFCSEADLVMLRSLLAGAWRLAVPEPALSDTASRFACVADLLS